MLFMQPNGTLEGYLSTSGRNKRINKGTKTTKFGKRGSSADPGNEQERHPQVNHCLKTSPAMQVDTVLDPEAEEFISRKPQENRNALPQRTPKGRGTSTVNSTTGIYHAISRTTIEGKQGINITPVSYTHLTL